MATKTMLHRSIKIILITTFLLQQQTASSPFSHRILREAPRAHEVRRDDGAAPAHALVAVHEDLSVEPSLRVFVTSAHAHVFPGTGRGGQGAPPSF